MEKELYKSLNFQITEIGWNVVDDEGNTLYKGNNSVELFQAFYNQLKHWNTQFMALKDRANDNT